MYFLNIQPELDKILAKLIKRNRKQYEISMKKMEEIVRTPHHTYKFLHEPLQTFNRAHIDNHFILVFKIDHAKKEVRFYHYDHHDEAYKWRPSK